MLSNGTGVCKGSGRRPRGTSRTAGRTHPPKWAQYQDFFARSNCKSSNFCAVGRNSLLLGMSCCKTLVQKSIVSRGLLRTVASKVANIGCQSQFRGPEPGDGSRDPRARHNRSFAPRSRPGSAREARSHEMPSDSSGMKNQICPSDKAVCSLIQRRLAETLGRTLGCAAMFAA